jgi:predicted SnoaL-like aldol condensation-catalyzing enzyme
MVRKESSRKDKVCAVLEVIAHGGKPGTLEDICAPSYLPHVPELRNVPPLAPGLAALRARLDAHGPVPNRAYRLVADGDFVYAQVRYAGETPTAGADLFRFDAEGRIAEHWNLRQEIRDEVAGGYDRYQGGGDPGAPAGAARLARQKQKVRDLYLQLWGKGQSGRVTEFYTDAYLQHNPHIPSGSARIGQILATDIAAYIARERHDYPIAIHHLGSEGDLVYAWCAIYMAGLTRNEGDRSETLDIFRVDDDLRMAEHWDVLQIESVPFASHATFY